MTIKPTFGGDAAYVETGVAAAGGVVAGKLVAAEAWEVYPPSDSDI